MTKISMFSTLVVFLMIFSLSKSSLAQTNHTVGDSSGWRIPSGGAATYVTWASQQTFLVGDVVVFNFPAGTHDVAEVTKEAFDGCTTSPISTPTNSSTPSPATVLFSLNSAKEYYFVCTFTGHCARGQKLSVSVSSATSPPVPAVNTPPVPAVNTPPAPSTSATSPPVPAVNSPPAPSKSVMSLSTMALPLALLSIVVAIVY